MIDITKPHQTRDGRAVRNLHYRDGLNIIWGYVSRFSMASWYADGRYDRLGESALDLIPVPERRMKETAVTADQAKKVMEYNMNIDEDKLLGFARSHILAAQRICSQVGFMFDKLVDETRNKDKLIRMDRKYRTRNGERVRIVCTDGPGAEPVVGFVSSDGGAYSWDAFGKFRKTEESGLDLFLDEGAP